MPRGSKQDILARRALVEPLWVKHVPVREAAAQLGVSHDTIEDDYKALSVEYASIIELGKLRTVKLAMREFEQLLTETWRRYDKPPKKTKPGKEQDDTKEKIALVNQLLAIMREMNRLAGFYSQTEETFASPTPDLSKESLEVWREKQKSMLGRAPV
jgi:DNA-binding transcriptional MocR family regulator